MKQVTAILLLIILLSCGSKKTATTDTYHKVTDSISRKEKTIYRDSIITVPKDSVKLQVKFSELSEVPVIKKTGRTTVSLTRTDDHVKAECHTEALEMTIQLQHTIIEILQKQKIEDSKTITIPERYVPKPVKVLAWAGGLFFVVIIISVILRIKNII